MFKLQWRLVVLSVLFALSHSAHAAPWESRFFNPKPLPEDVVIPLPCDGALTFRKVLVPGA